MSTYFSRTDIKFPILDFERTFDDARTASNGYIPDPAFLKYWLKTDLFAGKQGANIFFLEE